MKEREIRLMKEYLETHKKAIILINKIADKTIGELHPESSAIQALKDIKDITVSMMS